MNSNLSDLPPNTVALSADELWAAMRVEAAQATSQTPLMASYFHRNILNHGSFKQAISFYLANVLATDAVPAMMLRDIFLEAMGRDSLIEESMRADLMAHYTRDPACDQYITPFLYFKGYHAIQSYRVAHELWRNGRRLLANYIQSRVAELFDVDIHPAATIAGGLMVDHATGVVIGETAEIHKNVSMLHAVTLGGSGAQSGKRHPTIEEGVLLSVGTKVLGNVTIGKGSRIGAGSVVLKSVPAHATAVGVPARVVGGCECDMPALEMTHQVEPV